MSASFRQTGTSFHVHCPSLFALLCIIRLFLLPLSHLLGCTITTLSTYIHSHTTSQHYYQIWLRKSWQPGTHYHANTDTCSLSACLCSRFWTRMEIHRPGYFSTLRTLRHPDPLFSPFFGLPRTYRPPPLLVRLPPDYLPTSDPLASLLYFDHRYSIATRLPFHLDPQYRHHPVPFFSAPFLSLPAFFATFSFIPHQLMTAPFVSLPFWV